MKNDISSRKAADMVSKHDLAYQLKSMWEDYLLINPDAERIYKLFEKNNKSRVINDHIALRTFNLPPVSLDTISGLFLKMGYRVGGNYRFKEKKLKALHLEHENSALPKIFISELLVEALSDPCQEIIHSLVSQVPASMVHDLSFCYCGKIWKTASTDYQQLLEESEYGAWMAAFGYRPNHFTVSVNHLDNFSTIEEVNTFLQEHDFQLNASGGLIKGSPDVYLEQSSTMASRVNVLFDDGVSLQIPGCFYEFAKRYTMPDGDLYQGFVAASADKIFESTYTQLADS